MMKTNTHCRICHGTNLEKFLSLGDQPPANRFLKKEELMLPEPRYPLDVYFCRDCHLAQLLDVVDKEELFRHYIYFSSGMPKLSSHFKEYADDVTERFLQAGGFVLEIASNDGILLKHFQDAGYRALGVDPATNIAKVAESRGVRTINDFWSERLGRNIAHEHGKPDVILANNVVAHIDDHHDLVRGISAALAEGGVFVMEAPYLADMFDNLTYDTIYHEHLSYLAVAPLKTLFEKFGMEIFEVQAHPVQGQSLRVFAGHKGKHAIHESVARLLADEKSRGFHDASSYHRLARRIASSKERLVARLTELRAGGKRIAAYGAPAKGNTILNYCGIGTDSLEYALEDLPSKQGLYTPGMHIPVTDRAHAAAHPPDIYLLLAWNYRAPILEKEAAFREQGGTFIIPVGDEIEEI